ncbi:hypothetical protein, partial [Xanthomonas arboricola]|uniref:hypothetical protein n=1 Tax=Xanthomonas arboricola TaxID=56448 RepID=UPI001CA5ADFC
MAMTADTLELLHPNAARASGLRVAYDAVLPAMPCGRGARRYRCKPSSTNAPPGAGTAMQYPCGDITKSDGPGEDPGPSLFVMSPQGYCMAVP